MFKRITYGNGTNKRNLLLTPYTSREERDILIASTFRDDEVDETKIDDIFDYLKSHITPNNINFSKNEKKFLLYQLRGISVGEEIQIKNICPYCKKAHDATLDTTSFIECSDITSDIIIENVKYNFTEIYKDFTENPEDYISELSGEIINTSDKEEISLFIEDLTIGNYDTLIEEIKKRITVFNFFHFKDCPYCHESVKFKMNEDKYIIEALSEDSLVAFFKTVTDMTWYGKYSKEDIDSMYPFERNIYAGLLQSLIEEYNRANPK